MWAQIQYNKIYNGYTISLFQLITDLTNKAQQKDLTKSFIIVNKPLGNSRLNKQSN